MRPLLLLLCVLEYSQAAWMPHPSHPALWGAAGKSLPQGLHTPGDNPARQVQGTQLGISWSAPVAGFHEMGMAGEWGKKHFRVGGAVNWSALDTLYRQMDLSGAIGQRLTRWWRSGIGYTFTNAWVPGLGKWYYQEIDWGNTISLANVLTLSGVTTAILDTRHTLEFYGVFGIHMNLHPAYQLFFEVPVHHSQENVSFRSGQTILLGHLGIQNVVSWPGPALGFGLRLQLGRWQTGIGHTRSSELSGRTGYTVGYRKNP